MNFIMTKHILSFYGIPVKIITLMGIGNNEYRTVYSFINKLTFLNDLMIGITPNTSLDEGEYVMEEEAIFNK